MNVTALKAAWELAKQIAGQVIDQGMQAVPGDDVAAREEWVVQVATMRLESVDQSLPAIGQYMDLPVVDWAERQAVRQIVRALVRHQWAVRQIEFSRQEATTS